MIIKAGESIHWDNRFRIFSQKKIFCETFNDEKWLLLKDNYKKLKDYKEINYEILKNISSTQTWEGTNHSIFISKRKA